MQPKSMPVSRFVQLCKDAEKAHKKGNEQQFAACNEELMTVGYSLVVQEGQVYIKQETAINRSPLPGWLEVLSHELPRIRDVYEASKETIYVSFSQPLTSGQCDYLKAFNLEVEKQYGFFNRYRITHIAPDSEEP